MVFLIADIPAVRAVNEVFEAIAEAENREFLLRVSFMEIYNEVRFTL